MTHPKTFKKETALIENQKEPYALLDNNFKFIRASNSWLKKFNLTEKKVKGRTLLDIFPRFDNDWKTRLQYALDGLPDIQIIDTEILADKSTKKYVWNLNPCDLENGKASGVLLSVKEVDPTKELQLELKQAKNLLSLEGEIARIGSWDYEVEQDRVTIAPIVAKIFRVKPGDELTLARAIRFYKAGKTRAKMQELLNQAITNGIPWNENLELVSKNGERRWVNTIGKPKFKDGRCARIIGTVQDISGMTMAPVKVDAKSSYFDFEDFFELSPSAMILTDYHSGKILKINDATSDLTGYTEAGMKGRFFPRFISLKEFGGRQKVKKELFEKNKIALKKVDFTTKDGKDCPVTIKSKLVYKDSDSPKVLSVIIDRTPTENHLENLKAKIKSSESANEKLVNFTRMVTHNLKGHAVNFNLLLNLLSSEQEESERRKIRSVLLKGTENLDDTIKGLREIVSIRNNENCKKETVVLNDHVYKVEQSLAGKIKGDNVKMINEIPDDLTLNSAPVYLESILRNCISNAITFRKPNKKPVIVLSAVKVKRYTILSIEDNGIGIDLKKDKSKLFQLYKTLNNTSKSRGMGLYLTKYQIELMKGKIEVESVLGEGSTFKIYFPNS